MKTYKQFFYESPFTTPRKPKLDKMSFRNGIERVFGIILGRQTIVRIFKTDTGIPKGFLQWGTKETRLDDLKIRITPQQILSMSKADVTKIVNKAIDDRLI